jgi:CHAT domain-containing protein/tetratricopeptide (TPR) repeat protein
MAVESEGLRQNGCRLGGFAMGQMRILALLILGTGGRAGNAAQSDLLMRDYNLAWQLNGQLREIEAIPLLKQIIAKDKTFHRAYRGLVEAYRQKRELDQAEEYFRSLVAQDPKNGLAHYGLGDVYIWKQQWGLAADNYIQCIHKSPDAHVCPFEMAFALVMHRKHKITTGDLETGLLDTLKSPLRELTLANVYAMARESRTVTEAQVGLGIAQSQGNAELVARFHSLIGEAYTWVNDFAKSTMQFEESLRIYQERNDLEMQLQIMTQLGDYAQRTDPRRARSYLESGLALARRVGHQRGIAQSLVGLGWLHTRQGDQEEALRCFEEAKQGFENLNDDTKVLGLLLDIGSIHEEVGDLDRASRCFNECRTTARKRGQRWFEAFALRRLGDIYRDSGDYMKALESLAEAVGIFRENGNAMNAGAALRVIASVHSDLGNYAYARDYFEQSLSEAREFTDTDQQERTLQGLGRLYLRMEQAKQAFRFLRQALSISDQTRNTALRTRTLLDIGNAYGLIGDDQEAAANLSEALRIARQIHITPEAAAALAGLGRISLKKGDVIQSEEYFRESLALAQPAGFVEAILAAREGLAETCLRHGKTLQALQHLEVAVQTIETLRGRIPTAELRTGFLQQNWRVYEDIIDVLTQLDSRTPGAGYDAKAFAYLERGRARAFLDLLAEAKANITNGLTPDQFRRQTQLRFELSRASAALLREGSKQNRLAVERAEHRLVEWALELRRTNPQYHELQYPRPYDAAMARSMLAGTGTIILEYALGERRSSLWIVTEKQIRMVLLPARREIERQAESFRSSTAHQPKGNFDAWQAQARHLYQLLVGPADEALRASHNVVIVPDGVLHYLPFESLISTSEGNPPRYLIEDYAIAYSPSATVYGNLLTEPRKQTRPAPYALLAYGDPVFGMSSPGVATRGMGDLVRSVYRSSGIQFAPLPNTRTEVENIGALYPPERRRLYLGPAATEASVKRENLLAYNQLHFATHAVLDEQVPARSGVVLSLIDTGDEDGILRANEIFNLKLNADLVVLSACQTGLGKLVKGEGMIGLTRAFLYAGSARVVVSLWEVNDLATAEFMRIFYQKMKDGITPGLALRGAKLEMMHSGSAAYRHPYFWTPFVLVGAF